MALGLFVGSPIGGKVGCRFGAALTGVRDGLPLGAAVGIEEPLGLDVGVALGLDVGVALGLDVG